MISNLKIQWQQETLVDFSVLQDVCDTSQDRVVMVLLQLQQRIIMAGPIENMKPPPLFWDPNLNGFPQVESHVARQIAPSNIHAQTPQSFNSSTSSSPNPSNGYFSPPPAYREPSSPGRIATVNTVSEEKSKAVTRMGLFGRKRKDPITPIDPFVRTLDASATPCSPLPAVPEIRAQNGGNLYPGPVHRASSMGSRSTENSFDARSRAESISTRDGSSILEPDQPEFNPWASQDITSKPHTDQDAQSTTSSVPSIYSLNTRSVSSFRRPVAASTVTVITSNTASISAKDLLPSEANKYSGFCKGAWRLQIGDKKKAMDERQRPGGMYNAAKYWQCSRCKFEGRLVMLDKKTKGYDRQVMLADGIQFRWEFLFKSHVECRDSMPNPLKASFGCIFCCAEGRGTPTFGGAQSLMDHLQEHRIRLPNGEVLYRMNCRVGQMARIEDDFDINLVARDGITI